MAALVLCLALPLAASAECIHDWVKDETIAPTCEEGGHSEYHCSVCQETKDGDFKDALGHNYVLTESVEPTCTKDGFNKYACSRCGDATTTVLKATKHAYGEPEIVDPTCTTEGKRIFTCSKCGDSYSESIAKINHIWDSGVVTEPTCTAKGYTLYTCQECGATMKTDATEKLGHNPELQTIKDPTCTNVGVETYKCSRCGEVTTKTIPCIPHNWAFSKHTDPTCTRDGANVEYCTMCGDTKTSVIPALGHNFDWANGTVTLQPDCEHEGIMSYPCTRCNATSTEAIAALCHEYKLVESRHVDKTCLTDGKDVYICERCGAEKVVAIKAPGKHNWVMDHEDEATCEKEGKRYFKCANAWCSEEMTQTIAALGHAWIESARVEPTCQTEGKISYECANCDKTMEEKLPKSEHAWSNGVVVGQNTVYTCTVCGTTKTEPIHTHKFEVVPAVAATCTESGLTAGEKCACGEWKTEQKIIAALGHKYTKKVVKPTTTSKGYDQYTCRNCGDSYRTNYTDKRSANGSNAAGTATKTVDSSIYDYLTLSNDSKAVSYTLNIKDSKLIVTAGSTASIIVD